jgi:hypothetical protein
MATDAWRAYAGLSPLERLRKDFEEGDKRALFEAICWAGASLPDWVRKGLREAHERFECGDINSWEDIFGKPFPGKSRKTAQNRALGINIWVEVRRRIDQGQPIDEHLFEQVGKSFDMKHSTVSKLYYWFDKAYQPGWPGAYDDLDGQSRALMKRLGRKFVPL